MNMTTLAFALPLIVVLQGCQIPQIIRPVRLYDLKEGKTIEVFMQPVSKTNGRLVSAQSEGENFEGEYVVYTRPALTPATVRPDGMAQGGMGNTREGESLAELYGLGKDSNVRPEGTGIIVGDKGTTIEIVLYRVEGNLEAGDGVARDNKGRYFRVFLSIEEAKAPPVRKPETPGGYISK
ncbi:MAG TPA: hypothetical protein VMF59_07795 [Bacteroidota bacterium]|nr:hypothetical protein [Bacteroidota bacterium]